MGAKADIGRSQDAIRRAQSEIERAESTHSAYHAAYTRLKQASEQRPGLVAEQELDDALAKDKEKKPRSIALGRPWLNRKTSLGWRKPRSIVCRRCRLIRTSQLLSRA